MDYKEFSGKSLENVISDACKEFSVLSENLDYEIVDMGSTGFLGFNSKPTIIRAKVKDEYLKKQEEARKSEEKAAAEAKRKEEALKAEAAREEALKAKAEKEKAEAKKQEEKRQAEKAEAASPAPEVSEEKESRETAASETVREPLDEEKLKETVRVFLTDVFRAMDMDVQMDIAYLEKENSISVDLTGKEMGVLIGKRGQTLDSLQYLVSLVVNKGTSEYIRVKVDTENYRNRRQKTLENLAKNLSFKVKRTKRPVTLEPMNPYERRIIHSALQGDRYVTTHSEGDEPFRRVVITPKR